MKSSAPILALIVLITVGFSITTSLSDTSPGPLSAVHGAVDELHGSAGCEACHGTEQRPMDQACGDCHAPIGEQLTKDSGFHGHLPEDKKQDCGHCHIEHLDESTGIVGERAFVKSGWTERKLYEHEKLDFALTGRHEKLACKDCHENADAEVISKGQYRFLGLDQDCKTCHEDPHEGKAPDCASCHGQERPFAEVALFEHDPRFPLTGSHSGISCERCHEDGDYTRHVATPKSSAQDMVKPSGQDPHPVRDCASCHESPHTQGFIRSVARRARKIDDQTCSLCHAVADASLSKPALDKTLGFHGLTGFELQPPHAELACAACHQEPAEDWKTDVKAQYAPRFSGRKAEHCEVCHGDPHEGQFTKSGQPAPACLSCHQTLRFLPHGFDLARHKKTGFPLHGAHEKLGCEQCHENRNGKIDPERYAKVRKFVGTPKACKECHESPHRGQFDGGAFVENDCLNCHGDERFFPSNFTAEMHAKTQFALEGAHRAIDCRSCHKVAEGKQRDSREIGDRIFRGTESECQACHIDVHDGAFDREGLPRTVDGKESCQRCHGQESFDLAEPKTFRHGFWTGLKLQGAHAKARCESCHIPGKATHGGTRTMGRAKKDCADCHENPHMGQFRVQGRTDCKRCHSEDLVWKAKKFSHDTDSRFKLGKDHSGLACSKCHKDYELPGGGKVVRYKPLGTQCKDCHLWRERR